MSSEFADGVSMGVKSAARSASLPLQAILVSTLQNMTIGVLAVGRDGVAIVANPAACRLLGADLEHLAGRPAREILAPMPGAEGMLEVFGEGRVALSRRDWTRQTADGAALTLELTAAAAEPPWDAQLAGLVLIEDVTEMRRLESQAALRSRLTGMGEMAIQLAHEIRNPLGSIVLLAGMLEQDLAPHPERAVLASQILAGVRALDHLVANTLEFARPRRLSLARVSLAEVVADALGWIEHPLAQKSGRVEFDISRAPQAAIAGDGEQLRQVFLNLLLNAVQSIDEGGRIRVALEAAPGGWRVTVADDGHGIPPAIAGRIFDPFFTTRDKGSGIGLAVVHAIVSAHGGRVETASERGRGATFLVYLPEEPPVGRRAMSNEQ